MPNRLVHETSPYLQQHSDNPVDWHAWNPDALRLAREQDKPILLSIGYSACHWCHVMAHESFEDPEIAEIMNRHFINIKVDREERPDLDHIYQTAHYLLTEQGGGWPLTMFLTPDGTPFFGGTYFPKWNSHNLPAFPDVLKRVAQVYAEHRAEIVAQGQRLVEALSASVPSNPAAGALSEEPLRAAVAQLNESFDAVHGGFGGAPKFPHAIELDFLLRVSHARKDEDARRIVLHSLRQIAHGGIYDQIGGGFFRYSVDERWDIPHFEKMLYDNGLLLALYSDAWQCTGKPLFAHVAEQTAAWVMREMQAPEGGYYSSLDADSDHKEGKFYVWQRDEVQSLLTEAEFAVAEPHFGLDRAPGFEQHSWHLRFSTPLDAIAHTLQITTSEATERMISARNKLFVARERRNRPGRDEKVLGSWNGLMITGMARASRVFGRKDWLRSAQRAMDFVRGNLWHDGKLLATSKDGRAHLNAYLDDHAFLLQAALELLQAEFRQDDLQFAVQLADTLLAKFEDPEHGGFFFTSHDHEALIQRAKIGQDNATPAGNGIAAQALQRLAALTGNVAYQAAAERTLRLFGPALQQAASYHSSLCTALAEYLKPPELLVLRGDADQLAPWLMELRRHYVPDVIALASGTAQGLPPPLSQPQTEQATGWLCKGTQCLPPITRIEDLLTALKS